jgi:hypothetical protein
MIHAWLLLAGVEGVIDTRMRSPAETGKPKGVLEEATEES